MTTSWSTPDTLKRCLLLFIVLTATLIVCQSPDAQAYGVMVANNGDNSISVIDSERPDEAPELIENVGEGPVDFAYERFSRYPRSAFFTLELDNSIRRLNFSLDGNGLDPFNQGTGVRPGAVELDLAQNKLYIVNRGPNIPDPPNGSLSIVDASGQTPTIEVEVGVNPSSLAVSRLRSRIYVTNHDSHDISVIDIGQWSNTYGEVIDQIELPPGSRFPSDIVKASVGGTEYLYVASKTGDVTAIDTETNVIRDTIPIPPAQRNNAILSMPAAITSFRDVDTGNLMLLVASWGSNSIHVIDTLDGRVVGDPIVGVNNPTDVEVAGDGLAYISNQGSNSISIVDTESRELVGSVDVGNNPTGVGIYPHGLTPPDSPPCNDEPSLVRLVDGEMPCVVIERPTDPPPPPELPDEPEQRVQVTAKKPERCERVLYENRLEVPREVRLSDLVNGKGIKVKASASKPGSGTVKVEITGRNARHFKLYKKTSSLKSKVLASAKVRIGSTPEEISLSANSKARKLIKRALRLKKAPKRTKLKVSLVSTADSSKSLKRLNAQTVRALRTGKLRRTDTYKKVRQVIDYSLCGVPLKAKIQGPKQTKLGSLITRKAKKGSGVEVKVSCSSDCSARVGLRMWGRYEVGLKFRKPGHKKNRWLSSRTVKLKAGETKTLKLEGISSKRLRKLLLRGAKKKRYDRVKVKYLIEARSSDGRSGAGAGTARVRLGF